MAYNSSHTGPEIDAAVGAVQEKEATWDGKQDKVTGIQGQVVGFDQDGDMVAEDKYPQGGTTGQILTQGANGAEWADNNALTATGGGTVTMGETIGGGPYQIEMADEDEDIESEIWTFFLADGTSVNKTILLVTG